MRAVQLTTVLFVLSVSAVFLPVTRQSSVNTQIALCALQLVPQTRPRIYAHRPTHSEAGLLRSRHQRGLEITFWSRSRSRSHSNRSWSRPLSHEVPVSVSYTLVSWSQIDLVFLKCNDFWQCPVFC